MRKKLLAVLLSAATVIGMVFPAMADEIVEDEPTIVYEEGIGNKTSKTGLLPLTKIETDDEFSIDINCDEIDDISEISEDGSMVYEHKWDRYSSNYFYNLLPIEKKKVWKAMDVLCLDILNGKEAKVKEEEYYIVGTIFSSIFDSEEELFEFIYIYKYSNPQYYFLSHAYCSAKVDDGYEVSWVLYPAFGDVNARANSTKLFEEGINSFKSEITGTTNFEKIKSVTDVITKRLTYNDAECDANYIHELTMESQYSQSAYSAFTMGNTVCAGYSLATELLLNDMGIDCIGVTSAGHAWNMVRLDDEWYHVDNTWNDSNYDANGVRYYNFFLKSDEGIKAYDDEGGAHEMEPCWEALAPKATINSASDEDNAYAPEPSTQKVAKPVISIENEKVTITCDTDGARIYYSTDGIDPSESYSRCDVYTGSFDIPYGKVIKAIATKNGNLNSEITSYEVEHRLADSYTSENGKHWHACIEEGCTKRHDEEECTKKELESIAPTCTNDGKTSGEVCAVCNAVFKAQEVMPATGHKWDNGKVTKEPTTEVEGVKTYTCTVCKDTKTEVMPKKEVTGDWKKDSKGWWFKNSDGTYPKSEWVKIAGKWYHFNESGYMQTGWVKSGGKWYYLSSSGAMATGWIKDGEKWYYLNSSGAMATGWIKSGGKWYYLSGSGAMATGWIKSGGKWYYLNSSGAMATGWIKDGGKWYYLYSDGHMAANEWIGNYHVNASGVWDK